MFGSYGRTAENGHVMPLAGPYLPVNKSFVLYIRLGLVEVYIIVQGESPNQ